MARAPDRPEIVQVETLRDFLECITPRQGMRYPNPSRVYRGQAYDRKLLPKLFRRDFDYYHQPSLNEALYAHLRDREFSLMGEFQRHSSSFLTTKPQNYLEWLAIAQHHGLETRLLDWTENSLTALFFAVSYFGCSDQDDITDAVVWELQTYHMSVEVIHSQNQEELEAKLADQSVPILLYFPNHITPRIAAQQGCFTVQTISPSYVPVDDLSINEGGHLTFRKFKIPLDKKKVIRSELETIGISLFSFFPDLDGLCRDLNTLRFF